MTERIRIGQLAASSGVSRDTIRFHERAGLLPKPRRTATRHRIYDRKSAQQIRSDSPIAGRRVAEILRTRVEAIEARIRTFVTHRDRLAKAIRRGGNRPDKTLQFLEPGIDDDRSVKEA